ncbi:MAG: NAD(P)H-dependent oxidoreductase [Silvanigrellaceae bacterium]
MSELELVQHALQWRYAVKKFDPQKKIPSAHWTVLKESLRMAPSSYGLQPWKFIVVENSQLRQKLREVSWNQSQVTDCSHYVVLAFREKVDPEFIHKNMQKISSVRNVGLESLAGFEKAITGDLVLGPRSKDIAAWAQRQVYIAMGFLLHSAGILKIDSTPMEGLDPSAYDDILELKGTGWKTVAAVALGYRHAEDPFIQNKKVRFDEAEVFVTK